MPHHPYSDDGPPGSHGARATQLPGGPEPVPRPGSPSSLLGELFTRFCELDTSTDMKRLADSVPREAPERILARYHAEAPETAERLHEFVERWFDVPAEAGRHDFATPGAASLEEHVSCVWPKLVRHTHLSPPYSSLVPLPRPYIVPGGIFRETYYWDTYFSILGLGKERESLRKDCVDNLAHLIDRFGFVPNGNRSYYLSRSQPPIFFKAVESLDEARPGRAFLRYLPEMQAEHAFWMEGEERISRGQAHRRVVVLHDGSVLNRYWDDADTPRDEAYRRDVSVCLRNKQREPTDILREIRAACESGWDFSSRWFLDRNSVATIATTSMIPIDLNSLLYGLERAIQSGASQVGAKRLAEEYRRRANCRRQAMYRHLWNPDLGLFDDLNWRERRLRGAPTAASLFALFCGLASQEQAAVTASTIERTLLAPGGVVATSSHTGEQWDAPNGWAPLQWVAVDGLTRYGHGALARVIASRWLGLVEEIYLKTGRTVEKYDVLSSAPGGGGEYPLQDGFGWTNGVVMALARRYPHILLNGRLAAVHSSSS
jgi:alpha,alpha-trehalase